MMRCDGCDRHINSEDITFHHLFGHVMRYCAECTDIWINFKAACEAQAQKLNAQLDMWEKDMRDQLPLRLTPLDLPRLMVERDGKGIVLG
jgi:hypothetical protein